MPTKKSAKDLSIEIFKIQKEMDKLAIKQGKLKGELMEIYQNEKFDKLETLLGTVVPVVQSGGVTYDWDSEESKDQANKIEAILSKINDKKKELSDASKDLTEKSKEPNKSLTELRRKHAEKIIADDARVSLRFTINK